MLVLFLYAFSALACLPDLTKESADVLEAIWGVRDKDSLMKIAANPKEFWHNRAKELLEGPRRALNHIEFSQRYTADAKAYIAQKLASHEDPSWLKKPEAIESMIKQFISENHPKFMETLMRCHAFACDLIGPLASKPTEHFSEKVQKKREALKQIRDSLSSQCSFHLFLIRTNSRNFSNFPTADYDMLRWRILPGGKFCLVDSLIMLSEGFFLCSVASDLDERANFDEHVGQFQGWYGAYEHDALAHSNGSRNMTKKLEKHGISYKKHFKDCCNPEALIAGDLITMSIQVIAWFTQFHEFPSAEKSYSEDNVFSMLFPTAQKLVDTGFMKFVPHFIQHAPEDRWADKPLMDVDWSQWHAEHCPHLRSQEIVKSEVVNNYILGWRHLYCWQGIRFLTLKDMEHYFETLEREFRYFKSSDIEQSPQFLKGVLKHLYVLDTKDGVIDTQCSFETFEEQVYRSAKECADTLDKLAQKRKTLDLAVPHAVRFLLLTVYVDRLRKAQSEANVVFHRVAKLGLHCQMTD